MKFTVTTMQRHALLSFLFCFLFVQVHFSQSQTDWINVAEQSTDFNVIKEAFMRGNANRLLDYQKDIEDLGAGRLPELPKGKYTWYKHFMRLAEWYEPRVLESNGDMRIIQEKTHRARLEAERTVQSRAANWTLLGPINQTTAMAGNGRVNAIRIDPNNANVLYACTPASQLFKSTNGGTSWTSVSNGILSTGVTDVAIDPSNSNILYAVTGDADRAIYHPYSTGVYKSTDGGATWATTGLNYVQGNGVGLNCILIHPTTPSTLLVGGSNGIRRSTDGGATWTQTSTMNTRELVFKPGDPSVVYAGSKSSGQVLKSTDNGVTWAALTLPTTTAIRYALDVSPANTNYVYAMATNSASNLDGIYRSTDGGTTWTKMSTATAPNIPNGQGWYNLCVVADPLNANTAYFGGLNTYKSTDGGTTLTAASSGVHVDFHDLTFSGTTTLYATSDGGVYKSTTGGSTWTNISSNLSIAQLYGLGLSTTNANIIISGHQDNGTNITSDLVNWRQGSGGDGMISFVDRTNNSIMYCTYQNGVLRKSTNGGTSFTTIYTVPGGYWVTPFIQDPVTATTLYTGGSQVYKSTNSGSTWTAISAFGTVSVRWLDVDKNDPQIIYAMTDATLYKTTDGGTTWATAATGLPTSGFLHIHIDVNNSNTLYLSRSSYSGTSVYRSTDAGASWAVWATGLPNVPANTIVTQVGMPGEVYCGTDIGVYYRNSTATSWTAFSTGMPTVPVRDLEIFYPTNKIRAATFGRSIWESPLNSTPVTTCDPTGTPSVSSVTTTSANVAWTAVAGAASYTLEYKTAAATTWTAVTGITSTSQSLTGLASSTTYNVRVTTVCTSGSSVPSTEASFTTLTPCDATSTPSVSSITTTDATVAWTAVANAVSYTLEYKTAAATTWTAITGLTTTSQNLTGLTASTSYNVRVTTVCAAGSSAPSATATFTTTAAPVCAATATPSVSSITTTGATVTWTAVANAVSYTLEYKTAAATTWTAVTGLTSTSHSLTGLASSTAYNVRVTTVCSFGSSTASTTANFTTLTPCNATGTPSVSSITSTSATVAWTAVAGASSYTLEYKTAAATTWTAITGLTTTSRSLTGLTASTSYNVRVTTVCASGSSAPSATATFTTSAAVACAAPSTPSVSGITGTGATVTWGAVAGAVSYRLEYKKSNVATWTAVTGLTTTSRTLTGLSRKTNYNVRVYAVCASATSAASAQVTFRTLNAAAFQPDGTPTLDAETDALDLLLSPNPASKTVTLVLTAPKEGDYQVSFNDIVGKTLLTQKVHLAAGENNVPQSIESLPTGLYIVRVAIDDASVVRKLLVE